MGCYNVGTGPIVVLCVHPICPTGYPTHMSNIQFAGLVGSRFTGGGALPLMGKRRGASKAYNIPYVPYQNGDAVPKRHMRPHHHHDLLPAHAQCKGYEPVLRHVSVASPNDDRVSQCTSNTHYWWGTDVGPPGLPQVPRLLPGQAISHKACGNPRVTLGATSSKRLLTNIRGVLYVGN